MPSSKVYSGNVKYQTRKELSNDIAKLKVKLCQLQQGRNQTTTNNHFFFKRRNFDQWLTGYHQLSNIPSPTTVDSGRSPTSPKNVGDREFLA